MLSNSRRVEAEIPPPLLVSRAARSCWRCMFLPAAGQCPAESRWVHLSIDLVTQFVEIHPDREGATFRYVEDDVSPGRNKFRAPGPPGALC